MSWKPLGSVLPDTLIEARVELHWATQLVSAVGTSLLPPQPDFSHTNCGWLGELGVLAGRAVGEDALRAALVFQGLELVVLDDTEERATLSLAGRTLEEGRVWLANELGVPSDELRLPEHEMPSHPVGDGGVFSEARADQRTELAAWFADASRLLNELVVDEPASSPVRCWPHHFDTASLIVLDPDAGPEEARSVGVGFSPGDQSYEQPYFYVNPWPYPDADALPPLEEGVRWHTTGWTGAVLTADQVISVPPEQQQAHASRALNSAIAASRAVLDE
ncbi:MAG: hypothetical protein OES69_02845 [Myxococcales bacterium]|nr:hypothetical protein [Myxococcales bacterium]MDH3842848.1 hypothetical protein [Myxococcales bacterium]